MSGNRRKSLPHRTSAPAPTDESARLVAIAKNPEPPVRSEPAKAKARTERIGEILRNTRLERGEDLYAIADYLRIKPAFLVALENSQYDEFPADAYIIGFLRSYAELLGLNGKDAVNRYRYEMAGRRKAPVLAMPIPLTEGRAPSALIMVGATIAALLVYALWYGISSSDRAQVTAPPALPSAQQVVPPSAPAADAAAGLTAPINAEPLKAESASPRAGEAPIAPAAIPPAAPGITIMGDVPPATASPAESATTKIEPAEPATTAGKSGGGKIYGDPGEVATVIIRATQSSWVMVTDANGKTIFDQVMKPGDTYKVPNKSGLSLTTGNAAGIVLSLNGTDLPKIAGGAPHVVRDISLDPDHLQPGASAQ